MIPHVEFQSLSSCEAQQLYKHVAKSIAIAYRGGMQDAMLLNVASGRHPKEIAECAQYRLAQAGLTTSEDFAICLVAQALAEVVRREEV